jgi:hypothetical protein
MEIKRDNYLNQLINARQAMGINAKLPKPHVCSEEEEKK